jgi:hypothetical protein
VYTVLSPTSGISIVSVTPVDEYPVPVPVPIIEIAFAKFCITGPLYDLILS